MLMECVPNFSEGRDAAKISRIAEAIEAQGARVLDRTADRDHHRAVVTFAGSPEAVERGAIAAAEVAVREIDLNLHAGVHPRIGAIDVIPFVPVSEATLETCAAMAHRVADALWERFALPSFFYEAAAAGRGLEDVRRAAMAHAPPDTGEGRHPTAGAVAIGARRFLIAWNILLATSDARVAKRIAREIRHSSGGFPGVKALGLELASRHCVQVSINSTDFHATPLHAIFDAVAHQAQAAGVAVIGSELIGLIPAQALSPAHDLQWIHFEPRMILENALL